MSDKKQPCPHCKKKHITEEYKLEWHKLGRQGKCPKCKKKVFVTAAARGIIKDENGVGRFIAIEIKTGKAVQTKEQKNYMKMVRNMGGIYIVGRDVDQVINDIKNGK